MSEDESEILEYLLDYLKSEDNTRRTKCITLYESELLLKYIQQKENIIKEVRELLKNDYFEDGSFTNYNKVFELLDKENKYE